MHSSVLSQEPSKNQDEGEVLVAIATLVTEGRIPGRSAADSKKCNGFHEGPHCSLKSDHSCDPASLVCQKFKSHRESILKFYKKGIQLCIEVLFTCSCKKINNSEDDNLDNAFLLEQWHFCICPKRDSAPLLFNLNQLTSAIRSQLYFSQVTAWLVTQEKSSETTHKIAQDNLRYRLSTPNNLLSPRTFSLTASRHEFPVVDVGNGNILNVSFLSAPRIASVPVFSCACGSYKQSEIQNTAKDKMEIRNCSIVDDRMQTSCTLKGKHRCEDFEEHENYKSKTNFCSNKRVCGKQNEINGSEASTSNGIVTSKSKTGTRKQSFDYDCDLEDESNFENTVKYNSTNVWSLGVDECHNHDLKSSPNKGQLLLDAIERSGQKHIDDKRKMSKICQCIQNCSSARMSGCDNSKCDMGASDILSIRRKNNFNIYIDKHCDSPIPIRQTKMRDISNVNLENAKSFKRTGARRKLTFVGKDEDDDTLNEVNGSYCDVPSPMEQEKFRKNLSNASSMVFHSKTGLPLTSSPAPVRKGKARFDFDSSLNSVTAIKSALFSNSFSTDDESESDGSVISPCSPEIYTDPKKEYLQVSYRRKGHSSNLLGSFEESVLNGRLEPVSTVHGFTAELGASGSFVPKHIFVPVTVFFYTFADNDKVSSPYLGHINLGRKGYNVPKMGTVQVTLFNPLGTVVKMFVVMYDLSDMPPNSQTFIRQRTLYMPTNCKEDNLEWGPKWLRFLIHLRFTSSKSGKIYLHSDIRMIIFRKCDVDTATAHDLDLSYELRSFTQTPTNPKYSSRK